MDWDAAGKFQREVTIPAGKFAELCALLEPGIDVDWSFSSEAPMDFNVHYHLGKDVRMPERSDQTRTARGVLVVTTREDYCWMWTNKTTTPATVKVQLNRPKPASR